MLVIGLTGPIGSGKSSVAEYLIDRYEFVKLSIGDLVREYARKEGLKFTRENLDRVQKKYRDKHGPDFFAEKALEKIKDTEGEKFVIDGIRMPEDSEPLKRNFDDRFVLLLVDAKPKIRFRRLKRRGRPGDPETFEEFKKQDERELENFKMEKTFKKADYTINNNGRLEKLKKKVDRFLKQLNR